MVIREFQHQFERLAPPSIAWKGDNIGLLLGREDETITNLLVSLDVTMEVVREAKQKKANLIVSHHPILFHPVQRITSSSRVGELVLFLTENKINVFAAHTNLDSVQWGVNFVLANALQLKNVSILSPVKESLTKIVVFVPPSHLDVVAEAMHESGAGMFSRYDQCSFRSEGIGTFRGKADAKPYIGTVGVREKTKEIRLEMLAESWKVNSVISAMKRAHPYEEVAYDIYPLVNRNAEYGLGAIGDLPKEISQKQFLSVVKKAVGAAALRFSGKTDSIRRVAVCGGSGSEFIETAIARNADAMVTADVKYHTFQEFENSLLLVDAGHYETEHLVLPALANNIQKIFSRLKHKGKVFITQHSTNPVQYIM